MIRSHDQAPLFEPESDWSPPTGPLPRLRGVTVAIDIETRDDSIAEERGAGWVYDSGYIAGVAAAWRENSTSRSLYVPIRHPSTECRSREEVADWAGWLIRNCHVLFHRGDYDLPWLLHEGVDCWPEHMDDTYVQAVMLDENHLSYDLDSCCARAGVPGKSTSGMINAGAAYGILPRDIKKNIWRLPARYVGPYAEQDAIATLDLFDVQRPLIERDGVEEAYRTEIRLMRVIRDMRLRGIRVSTSAAERAQVAIRRDRDEKLAQIASLSGRRVRMEDLRSPDSLEDIFRRQGVSTPRTPKTGKASVTKDWLANLDAPIGAMVREARQLDELADKFIGTYILGHEHRGRIHAEIHQLRDADGGTRTFRLSYSNPPLQQMPSRDKKLAPIVRRIFLPDEGCWWFAPDYSQQEFRIAVDRAFVSRLRGADEAVHYYCTDSKADFHQFVIEMTRLDRKSAKIINFGMMFGMGVAKLARSLGISLEAAEEMLESYHHKIPWISGLSQLCESRAQSRGYVRLIDGARCHFDHWEPARRTDNVTALRRPEAEEAWPGVRLRRAQCRKAMNRVVSGSAARQMKKAMVDCYDAGIVPILQMHDELCFSLDSGKDGSMVAQCMRDAYPLKVPVVVDEDWGATWGSASQPWESRMVDKDAG